MSKRINTLLTISTLFIILPLTSCAPKDVESEEKHLILRGPEDKSVIDIMQKADRKYVDAMHEQAKGIENDYVINDLNGDKIKIANYLSSYSNSKGVKVNLGFEHKGFGEDKSYYYHVAEKEDFSDEIKYPSRSTWYQLNSLKANTTYYWKVTDYSGTYTSDVKSFTMSDGWRGIEAGSASNIRDMGGHMTKSGKRIKQGLIYRGSELNPQEYIDNGTKHPLTINDQTITAFRDVIKIGTEIDFRGVSESNNITRSNMGYNIIYDRQAITAYGKLLTHSTGKYVKNIFLDFLNAKEDSAVYFHCMGGADRTGTIAFLLGGLLGMSYTDLVIDFELTSFSYNLREHDKVGQYSDFPSLISELKRVTNGDNNTEISTMCENWLTSSYCGLTKQNIEDIKSLLLED